MKTIKYKKNNQIQKILFLLFAVCFLLHPDMQVHAEDLLIQLSQNTVQEGETFTVTVMVPAGASAKVYLNYSPEIFKYVSSAGEVNENSGVVSAQINASGESYTAFSVKFQAASAGDGSFVASAEDGENIGGASVRVSVGANPNADVTPPEPEPDIQQKEPEDGQDSEAQESQTEPAAENQYYEVDGEKLYPSMMIPAGMVPEGFTEGKITLWGESYPYLYREGGSEIICLLYLVDENHENGALYIVDKNSPYEVYPFVCVDRSAYRVQNEKPQAVDKTAAQNEDVEKLKSQNRLILCAFVVVVLILLIIIVVLMIRRGDEWEDTSELPEKPKKKTQPEPKQQREPERKIEQRPKPEPKQKREPERKTEQRPKSEPKQKREPEWKTEQRPKPEQKTEQKTKQKTKTALESHKKQKKSAFWDAMFAGIDDDLSMEGFDEETPEERQEKKTVRREVLQNETTKKQKKPDAGSSSDEDIEFIDL